MPSKARPLLIVLVLVLWVLVGPLVMALDGCSGMGAMCEGLCGLGGVALLACSPGFLLPLAAWLTTRRSAVAMAGALNVPEPPPRPIPLSV